jgi:uncharacterized protein (DUF169 family)
LAKPFNNITNLREVDVGTQKSDIDVLGKLGFAIKPIGVRYLFDPPEKIKKIEGKLALCEMLKKAQEGKPFYIDAADHSCEAGAYVLGQEDIQPQFISGAYGAGLGAFKDQRAAARVYNYIPKIAKGVMKYVSFATLGSDSAVASDPPDVTIIIADTRQTWILLRALSYETGEQWSSHFSPVIGCAWLFAWPYIHGHVNFVTTGLGFGMRRRSLFPEGMQFIAIPFDRWPDLIRVLQEMPWTPEPFKPGGLEYVSQLRNRLNLA